ncbi:putative transcription elongation factor SPT5 1 isoform X2 [Capsicum galapagoense]
MPRFHKGKQGSVEHIFNGIVFINDRQQLDHTGFIGSKTRSCELIDGSRANGDRNGNPYSSRSAPHNSILCSSISNEIVYSWPAFKLHKDGRGHGTLAGADVNIRLGPFKGCKRRVRNIKGTSVFVELKARMKVVPVTDQSITSGLIDINLAAEMMDPALPPNPKEAVLYRPVPLLTSVVATTCEELSPESVVLLYISASGLNNLYPCDLLPFT